MSEDDIGYDGCSVPDWVLQASWPLSATLTAIAADYGDKFGRSNDKKSSPCFVHDLAYNHYAYTYGFTKQDADDELVRIALRSCKSKAKNGQLIAATSCSIAAGLFKAALDTSFAQDEWNATGETCYDMHGIGIQPTSHSVCECALGDISKCPAPPIIPDCSSGSSPGDLGCDCEDVLNGTVADLIEQAPDGAGSYLETNNPRGQYCIGPDIVCGAVEFSAGSYDAMCLQCGVHTNLGCECTSQNDCIGIEPDLRCWGAESDGWNSGGVGHCLRDPAIDHGGEPLSFDDYPWLCPDNCDAISPHGAGSSVCAFGEFPGGVYFPVGTCVDTLQGCSGEIGTCESDGSGKRCTGSNSCEYECDHNAPLNTQISDCSALGFDEGYVCGETNRCVPATCGGGVVPDWCNAFLGG